jgi:Flagellar motor protein
MAKRKPEDPPAGLAPWMATFSDLMNLLLCFFVLLFSMSSISEEKYNQFVASMSSAFSILDGGATAIGDGILISNGVSQLNELDEYINSTGKNADSETDSDQFEQFDAAGDAKEELFQMVQDVLEEENLKQNEEMAERISEVVNEANLGEQIEVNFTSEYITLSLKGAFLFDSGKAAIKEEALPALERVGAILERYAGGVIEIEGHTDNVPMHNAQFANNNELSSARALSVFDYLVDNTSLDPALIKHSGRGEYVPVADNGTDAGRAKNRRVEIRIYNPPV